jgi:3-deoxy-D-manno-octulosonic-acid transferase
MQTESDANRLKKLGVSASKIKVTGNMKFDQLGRINVSGYKEKLGLGSADKLFIAGSTHCGEEKIILNAYKVVLSKFPGLKLLIAPRHPQRSAGLLKIISRAGFNGIQVSRLNTKNLSGTVNPVFVLDTIGELANFYTAADIVFVGGSLIKKGGHNILEPASLAKPVIFGPQMFNFRDIAGLFIENKAAILAENREDLVSSIEALLNDSTKVAQLTDNAKKVIMQNQGATKRNLEAIKGIANGN